MHGSHAIGDGLKKIMGKTPADPMEGTERELSVAEPAEDMSDEELAALNRVLDAAWESIQLGRVYPAAEVLAELRNKQ